ncbi:DUF1499 domain-containing protein [Granulosicoccus antarcticus]|uniref:DUF1499 domain-containing protein n=1 Tax=Granulosicoccus antarcticus IMCC3135 TaxID=1192854 RepID=A0A2Z2P2V1_9GAMM|nr:DUF1499 domain-containing protein [Granulosicoccus antarcticus]ASJ74907.1 hypothetical protein IMCC3135_24195 [Granulosicoccus antarcticus IMCC3135]
MTARSSRLGTGLLLLALCALVAVAVMMFGARLGLWEPIVGFGYARTYLNPMGYAVAGLGLLGLIYLLVKGEKAGAFKAAIACLLGLGMLAPMLMAKVQPPSSFPPIHDVSTDTSNPPQFLVLDESRPGARNSLVYGGEEIAMQQQAAFPDIVPVLSDLTPEEAFAKSLAIGQDMEWEIVAQDHDGLRFEATARTPIYHFADDVVVIVTPEGESSRIDIRSVSRIGKGDRGVNAARIRAFIGAVE